MYYWYRALHADIYRAFRFSLVMAYLYEAGWIISIFIASHKHTSQLSRYRTADMGCQTELPHALEKLASPSNVYIFHASRITDIKHFLMSYYFDSIAGRPLSPPHACSFPTPRAFEAKERHCLPRNFLFSMPCLTPPFCFAGKTMLAIFSFSLLADTLHMFVITYRNFYSMPGYAWTLSSIAD